MKEPLLDLETTNEVQQQDDSKKAVTFRSPDRKRSKERMVTHILSQDMLPPVTKRKLAVYQIINTNRKDPLLIGNATGDDVLPYDVVIPGTYMIYDPYENDLTQRDKMIRNVTRPGIEIKDGKQIQTEVVEDIIMHKGLLEVNQETQYSLYILMELHPLNGSNRRRNRSIIPVFERIDMKFKSVAGLDAFEDLSEDASRTVKDLPLEKVMGYAAALNIATAGVSPNDVKYALRMFAKQKPLEFFKLSPGSSHMVKINFLDAVELGFVEYVMNKGYRFSNTDKCFFTPAVGEEPVGACVKYLSSEKGVENYEKILNYLGFWQD
jgi:hypothetical protein